MYTGWAGLGLAAGGLDPSTVRRGGPSVLDYVRSSVASGGDLGDIERTILLARASGSSPRSFGGRDLVAAVLGHRRGDGSFDEAINLTAFAILALRAAGGASLDASAGWLANQQNGDGGFGPDPHSTSDVDDTGAVLRPRRRSACRACNRLHHGSAERRRRHGSVRGLRVERAVERVGRPGARGGRAQPGFGPARRPHAARLHRVPAAG